MTRASTRVRLSDRVSQVLGAAGLSLPPMITAAVMAGPLVGLIFGVLAFVVFCRLTRPRTFVTVDGVTREIRASRSSIREEIRPCRPTFTPTRRT